MAMVVYATIDVLEEKQKLVARSQNAQIENYKPFLGLLQECFMSQYQLDIYAQITCTNFKIIIVKNETLTNRDGGKPKTMLLQQLFDSVHTFHTNMILNPFYESTLS